MKPAKILRQAEQQSTKVFEKYGLKFLIFKINKDCLNKIIVTYQVYII